MLCTMNPRIHLALLDFAYQKEVNKTTLILDSNMLVWPTNKAISNQMHNKRTELYTCHLARSYPEQEEC